MEPIAIVGMACRFPKAPSLADFWQMLNEGRHGIAAVPPDRWDAEALYASDPKEPGKVNAREGGFIEKIEEFDAAFFGISPREAVQMDPQQRILLELTYEAFEDAGIASAALGGGNTAVYVGVMSNDYLRHQTGDGYRRIDVHTGGGAGFSMLANRISYQFDLHGPSMAIDSACSSSLVAVFNGCQALWTEQTDLALAGGVNLMLDPSFNVFYAKAGLMAADSRCRTFAAGANGIVRGEGAGLVVLKRERDALRDGDAIYAVIRGGAVNHGGHSNGVTAPNRWAQENLLRTAWRNAGVRGDQLQYVELHGTGTYIGDTIEANALGKVMKDDGRDRPCPVGSVKTNIGHQEGAAGVAGLIKLVLSMHHRRLAPSLWFEAPNPAIDFTSLPLSVNTISRPWPEEPGAGVGPLLAGISAFGLGGTNAHLVLSSPSAPATQRRAGTRSPEGQLLVLSARTEAALRAQTEQIRGLLSGEVDPAPICATLLRRRNLHEHRLTVVGPDRRALLTALEDFLAGRQNPRLASGRVRARAQSTRLEVPAGEGLDPVRAARWLLQAPHGREAWDACRNVLGSDGGERLPALEELAAASVPATASSRRRWTFSAQYALVQQLLASIPGTVTLAADGLGQLAACCAAGAIALPDALAWLERGLDDSPPPSRPFALRCDCAGKIDPPLSKLDWTGARGGASDRGQAGEPVTVVVNVDAATSDRAPDALRCLGQAENDFGHLFARLALLGPVRGAALADDRFLRIPSYPWQRQVYWIPKPSPAALAPVARIDAPTVNAAVAPSNDSFRTRLLAASKDARGELLLGYLRQRVAEALRMSPEQVDPVQPLNAMGIDSLTAVEIKNRIENDVQVTVSVVKFLDGFAISDFVALLSDELARGTASTQASAPPHSPAAPLFQSTSGGVSEQVAAMSIDEVEALLAQMAG